jgi:hypothetical protein
MRFAIAASAYIGNLIEGSLTNTNKENAMLSSQRLIDIIKSSGRHPRRYSGRNMFGRECVGVMVNDFFGSLVGFVGKCENTEEAAALVAGVTTDSMGRGTIAYWPSVEWVGEEEDDDEEEEDDEY